MFAAWTNSDAMKQWFAPKPYTLVIHTVEERVIRRDVLALKHGLSDRQRSILGHLLDSESLTLKELAVLAPEITRRTLQRKLGALVKQGVLTSAGATNRLSYRIVGRP